MAAGKEDEATVVLRKLRDRLALEEPRARTYAGASAELKERLRAALELVSRVRLLDAATTNADIIEEVRQDAIVEAHLALHDWERWLEQQAAGQRARARPLPSLERRVHSRHETNVVVKLLRYHLRTSGSDGVTLDSQTASRPARNISMGGIFVAMPPKELPQLTVGCVVHISVTAGPQTVRLRAAVLRRDDAGVGLGWMKDSDEMQGTIESLLEAVRRSRADR
jgi:hypothetical protein